MNGLTTALLGLTLALAVADWVAVHTGNRRAEWVLKPATMVPLIGAALALDPGDATIRWWFVAGLVFSLAGDVFLMLPNDRLFVFGLGSFLLGHLAYIGGLVNGELDGAALGIGAVIVAASSAVIGRRVVRGAADRPGLAGPVALYIGVISVMVVLAAGSTVVAATVGAALFYVSDANIGWTRFVADYPRSRVVIMTTYHLGQILLVVSLTDLG